MFGLQAHRPVCLHVYFFVKSASFYFSISYSSELYDSAMVANLSMDPVQCLKNVLLTVNCAVDGFKSLVNNWPESACTHVHVTSLII